MSKIAPVIQIDTREQSPLDVQAYPLETTMIPMGDYGLRGFSGWSNPRFIVARKSVRDLPSSLTNQMARRCTLNSRRARRVIVSGICRLRPSPANGFGLARATPWSSTRDSLA